MFSISNINVLTVRCLITKPMPHKGLLKGIIPFQITIIIPVLVKIVSDTTKLMNNTNKKFWLLYMTEDYFLLKNYSVQVLMFNN